MTLKIKKTPRGIKIKFHDPNNTNIFVKKDILTSEEAKKVEITKYSLLRKFLCSSSSNENDHLVFTIIDYTKPS